MGRDTEWQTTSRRKWLHTLEDMYIFNYVSSHSIKPITPGIVVNKVAKFNKEYLITTMFWSSLPGYYMSDVLTAPARNGCGAGLLTFFLR